jgi:hypothetical protein
VTDIFGQWSKMKIADALALAGDRGAYMLGLTDVTEDIKQALIEFIRQLGSLLRKFNTPKQLKEGRLALVYSMALLELKLPSYWCKITTHLLLHAHAAVI